MQYEVSLEHLSQFAEQFWKEVGDAKVILLHGQMGAGKTTTIAALCKYKGVIDVVGSPTFSIINQYQYQEQGEGKSIYHIDLYRLKDMEEIIQAGVEDCVYSGNICFIEWPEKAPELFDDKVVHVSIEAINETTRKIKILSDTAFHAQSMAEQS